MAFIFGLLGRGFGRMGAASGKGGAAVPTLALRDRSAATILDRFAANILTRV